MRFLIITFLCFVVSVSVAQDHEYIFVFLNKRTDLPAISKEETDRIMKGHMANIEKLASEGKLIAAGPFDGGGGIFIFKANTFSEVEEWISVDPGIQAKRWNIEMFPYFPRKGGVCGAKPPYEMVSYTFVRFIPEIKKFSVPDYPEVFKQHDDFLKEVINGGYVITEGVFGPADGGIIILKPDADTSVFAKDPAVDQRVLLTEIKSLWIAKGSFCEN